MQSSFTGRRINVSSIDFIWGLDTKKELADIGVLVGPGERLHPFIKRVTKNYERGYKLKIRYF